MEEEAAERDDAAAEEAAAAEEGPPPDLEDLRASLSLRSMTALLRFLKPSRIAVSTGKLFA